MFSNGAVPFVEIVCLEIRYLCLASRDYLRVGLSGDRIPVWGEIFRTCPDRPCGAPSLLYDGYRVSLPGVMCGRGVTLTPHPLLVPRSKME